jgi:hypothetical protein
MSTPTGAVSLSQFRPKTSAIAPDTGVPRYATGIGTSGAISFYQLINSKYDLGAVAFKETRATIAMTAGYVAPNTVSARGDGIEVVNNGYWKEIRWGNGYKMRVTAYYSGGSQDQYGNWISHASFKYFRLDFVTALVAYPLPDVYSHTVCGYYDHNGMAAGAYNQTVTSARSLTIVCKNKA